MECVDQAGTYLSTLQNAHKQQWWSTRLCTLFLFLLCSNTKDCDVIHSDILCKQSNAVLLFLPQVLLTKMLSPFGDTFHAVGLLD